MKPLTHRLIKKNLNKGGVKKIYVLLVSKCFRFFERFLGIHVTPVDYYSPIPDTHKLEEGVYDKTFECPGLDWNVARQKAVLDCVVPKYLKEYTPNVRGGLSPVDAFILYVMVRERKPKVMIEVGMGHTTQMILNALAKNSKEGFPCRFISIDPYPDPEFKRMLSGDVELIERKVQDVAPELLLTADILFIDSSHVSKIGSDVNFEVLEIVPKLKVGAYIHWHDITTPKNYWKSWIEQGNMFWNETYLVHSFLLFNDSYKIMWASQYLQLNYEEELLRRFPYYRDERGSLTSLWVERVKA